MIGTHSRFHKASNILPPNSGCCKWNVGGGSARGGSRQLWRLTYLDEANGLSRPPQYASPVGEAIQAGNGTIYG